MLTTGPIAHDVLPGATLGTGVDARAYYSAGTGYLGPGCYTRAIPGRMAAGPEPL